MIFPGAITDNAIDTAFNKEESAPPVVEESIDANNDKKLDSGLRDDEIVPEVEATTGGSATAVAHPVTIREMVTSHENDDEYVTCACGLVTLKNVPLFLSLNIGEAVHNVRICLKG